MSRACEDQYLANARQIILSQIQTLSRSLPVQRAEIAASGSGMWAETHLIRDFDDVANLSMHLADIAQHERRYADSHTRLIRLKQMLDAPYFGRIDFCEEGYGNPERIYVGRQSLFDESRSSFVVYDWRAPISSMYYDCGVGPAAFTAPDGEIRGHITLRRQFRIEAGELIYTFDFDINVDDEMLQRTLSQSADAKIKTIISSIQREQNRVIRCPDDQLLVFGPAGSGKTSVGLHRLAYLLYRYKDRLTSDAMRIVSASNVFATYIAGVIPELGEADVMTVDMRSYVRAAVAGRPFHDGYEQIAFIGGAAPDDMRLRKIALLYSTDFIRHMKRFISAYTPVLDENACFNGETVCDAARMRDLYANRTGMGSMASNTARVLQYVTQAYDDYFRANQKAIVAFFDDLYEETLSKHEIRAKFDEQKSIVLNDLQARLMPESLRLYDMALKAYGELDRSVSSVIKHARMAVKAERLFYEDALVLLFIGLLTGRLPKERGVKHVLIDEAQDYSPIHHECFRLLFGDCPFTVLADVNQALCPHIHILSQDELTALYPAARTMVMTKRYRSTVEINRFAARLLGDADGTSFFERHGDEPAVIETDSAIRAAAEILERLSAEYRTVGVLLSGMAEAAAFERRLRPHTVSSHWGACRLIHDADDGFHAGLTVMAAAFAKGLEFDAVLVPEYGSAAFEGAVGNRLLYLCCTRALHRLYLIRERTVSE